VLALNKIRSQVEFHQAAKRSVRRTTRPDDFDARPGGDDAEGVLQAMIDDMLSRLADPDREVIRLRVEGHEVKEIAGRTGRSQRSVERVLQDFRDRFADLA
jgi:DNA-directed RNA polymerase specialized sigma24 family protein